MSGQQYEVVRRWRLLNVLRADSLIRLFLQLHALWHLRISLILAMKRNRCASWALVFKPARGLFLLIHDPQSAHAHAHTLAATRW
jgi:hypothetical protein